MKVDKDLDFLRKMFACHDEQQQKGKRKMLAKGAAFLQNLCIFDPNDLQKALDEEIAMIEAQLAQARAASKELNINQLAQIMSQIEDGKIWKLGAKK